MNASTPKTIAELMGDSAPTNWGKWGPDDEVGSLNYLTPDRIIAGAAEVRSGEVFTLQVPIGDDRGDPVWINRAPSTRIPVVDDGTFERGELEEPADGHRYTDDKIDMFLQGTTQYDALGHYWYGGKIYNGYDASTTVDRMEKASVFPIADRGIVGRGVLIDMARHRGKKSLERGETFTHEDLLEAAAAQGTEIRPRDVLVIRTGWIATFYEQSPQEFFADWCEPGLTYSPELVDWFQRTEIPSLVTDQLGNETTYYPGTPVEMPLHVALMRNLGVTFCEMCWLDDLADACARDNRWTFLYAAAPIKVHGASGAPVNPIAIR